MKIVIALSATLVVLLVVGIDAKSLKTSDIIDVDSERFVRDLSEVSSADEPALGRSRRAFEIIKAKKRYRQKVDNCVEKSVSKRSIQDISEIFDQETSEPVRVSRSLKTVRKVIKSVKKKIADCIEDPEHGDSGKDYEEDDEEEDEEDEKKHDKKKHDGKKHDKKEDDLDDD